MNDNTNHKQDVYQRRGLEEFIRANNIAIESAYFTKEAFRYFIAPEEMSIDGQVIPKGGAVVSFMGSPFQYMSENNFKKWILRDSNINSPEEEISKDVITQENFQEYIEKNDIHAHKMQYKKIALEFFEVRERIWVKTDKGTLFSKGGNMIAKDPYQNTLIMIEREKYEKIFEPYQETQKE